MKRLLSGLLASLPLLLIPPQDTLAFAPKDGTTVEKRCEFELEFENWTLAIDGNAFGGWLPALRLLSSARFADHYVKSSRGRPIELVRKFGALKGRWILGDDAPQGIQGFETLSGEAVRFTWDEESGTYERERMLGTTVDIALEKLAEDADLRGLLPGEEIARGAKWTARGRPVMDALFGTTEMGLLGAPAEAIDGFVRDIALAPFRDLGNEKLEIDCTYLGRQDGGSAALAEVGLKILDQRFELDLASTVGEFLNAAFEPNRIDCEECLVRWGVDGSGKLVWNAAEGRYESFELALKLSLTCTIRLRLNGTRYFIELGSEGRANWTDSATLVD